MLRCTLTAAIAALIVAAPTLAMDDPFPSEPADPSRPAAEETERIVVTAPGRAGVTLQDYADDFVLEIGDPTNQDYALARWLNEVCVGVVNLPEDDAQYFTDHVSMVAMDVGLEVGGPGCTPNVVIIFTSDGAGTARSLLEEQPRVLFPIGGVDGASKGGEALEEFVTSDAAVRWWQATVLLDRDDNIVLQDLSQGDKNRPVERGRATRIRVPPTSTFLATYIIVDMAKTNGVRWGQLADYLAMVALAQVKPDASAAGYDSILSLFDADMPPGSLTDWDRTYLHALYEVRDHLNPQTQRRRLVRMMVADQIQGE